MALADREKILIVEDSTLNSRHLEQLLHEHYQIIRAEDGEAALRVAEEAAPDAILLDVVMPGPDGYEVLRRLQASEKTSGIPVLFITGLFHPEDEARGLQLGAVDYISRPFSPAVVLARISTHLKLARQRRLLETHANIDSLTEIPNRRYFERAFASEWGRARRRDQTLSVALADIDFFSAYNDYYGRRDGDLVLQRLASVLTASLARPGDMAARLGGGKFGLILPDTDDIGASRVCEKVRLSVEALLIPHPGSAAAHHLTVSLGAATTVGASAGSASELLKTAEARLFSAKKNGRNCVAWR